MPTVDFVSVAGLSLATTIIVQVILTAASLTPELSSRFGPLLAIAVAIVLAVAAVAATGMLTSSALMGALALGLTAGASAMGIHNVVTKSALGATVAGALGIPTTTP